jgi:transcriptional regulator with XRE-family HTH domain
MSVSIFTSNLAYLREKIAERRRTDFSRQDLAQQLGITLQALQNWESGTAIPNQSNLQRLASFFSGELRDKDITPRTLVHKNLTRQHFSNFLRDNVLFLRQTLLTLTKSEVIAELRVPKIVYSDWERGVIPERENIQKLAAFFSKKLNKPIKPMDLVEKDLARILTKPSKSSSVDLSTLMQDHDLVTQLNLTPDEIQTLQRVVEASKKSFTKKGLTDLIFTLRNETI